MSETLSQRGSGKRKPGYWRMRNARTGQYVAVAKGARKSAGVAKQLETALSLPAASVSTVFEALKAATLRSRSDGTPLQFTVEVEPSGEPRIVEVPGAVPSAGPEIDPATKADADTVASDAESDAELDAALAAARARGRDRVAEILAGPDMLSAEDLARHLNTTRATINAKRQAHQILGLQGVTRGYRYPAWQIADDGRPFAALPLLFAVLGDSPWAVYRFLVQHHGELDGLTGREALERGRDRAVLEAAESVSRDFA